MSENIRKIVAIGGGSRKYIGSGENQTYEIVELDREIIRLSGKEKPRILFLAHAQAASDYEHEKKDFDSFYKRYSTLFDCDFRWLTVSELQSDFEKAKDDVAWADVIYESGGNTVAMIELWRKTGFDMLLKTAWESGKVMCGISAGAICWFASGNTGVAEYKDMEINQIPGMGFIDAYFSPHCNVEGKRESEIRSLKHIAKVGLSVSNCSAIEIVGDRYRVIKSTPADSSFRPYVLRTYWKDGNMFEEELEASDDFRSLDRLLKMQD